MNLQSTLSRALLIAALAALVSATGGCRWLRGQSAYALSPESRPLEVPPDLDRPRAEPTLLIPEASRRAPGAPAAPAAVESFLVPADAPGSVWRRLGLALARIEGVEITERAQLLNAYDVRYEGETFLVRAQGEGEDTRVIATAGDGRALSGGAAARLLGILKQRLG